MNRAEDLYIFLSFSTNLNKLRLVVLAFFVDVVLSSRIRLVRGFGGLIRPGPVRGGDRRGRVLFVHFLFFSEFVVFLFDMILFYNDELEEGKCM